MSYELDYSKDEWRCIFTAEGNKRAVRNLGGLIAVLTKPSRYTGQDERFERELNEVRANQKLIAAAPKMFELLKKIESTYDKGTETYKEIHNLLTEITK